MLVFYVRRILFIFLLVLFFTGVWSGTKSWSQHRAYKRAHSLALAQRAEAWAQLKQQINARILQQPGEVGLVIKDLSTGWEYSYRAEQPFAAASIIKIGIMSACLQAAQDGRLTLDEAITVNHSDQFGGSGVLWRVAPGTRVPITDLLGYMIGESDNTASNLIIARLGMDQLNGYFQKVGLKHTRLERRLHDYYARARGQENYTSAADTALLLEQIYNRTLLQAQLDEEALGFLKLTKLRDRIPAKLPRHITVAHKTGLENNLVHDAGIVFTPDGDFLISAFTRSAGEYRRSKHLIADLTLDTYQYVIAKPLPIAPKRFLFASTKNTPANPTALTKLATAENPDH